MIVYTVTIFFMIGLILVISKRKLTIMTNPLFNKSINILGVRIYQIIRLEMLIFILINFSNMVQLCLVKIDMQLPFNEEIFCYAITIFV